LVDRIGERDVPVISSIATVDTARDLVTLECCSTIVSTCRRMLAPSAAQRTASSVSYVRSLSLDAA